jgi:hypothetical protein
MSTFRIFDAHQHVGSLDTGTNTSIQGWSVEEDYVRRTTMMDGFGVHAGIAMPSLQYLKPNGYADTRALNDNMSIYRETYRTRYPVALGTTEPMHGEKRCYRPVRGIICRRSST